MFWNLLIINYERYHLHHFLLFVLLIVYSICGAIIFCELESPNEDIRNAEEVKRLIRQSVSARNELVRQIRSMFFKRPNAVEFNETELRKAIEKYDINMATKPIIIPEKRWNMWGGLYYAGTLYTTIGYGDMAAETVWGRIFTIVYAIVGIPLMIIILNDWGTGMFHAVDLVWKKQFNFVVHRTKSLFHSKYRDGSKESFCNSSVSQVSKENPPNNPDRSEPIPLCLVAFVLIFWIVLCSAVFLFFENWTFFESLYFFFISLTTIGLGDFTLSSNAAVANFLPILIGLSVGSMAVNVIQMQLEILFTKIAELIDFDFKVNLSKSGEGDDVQPALSTTPSRKDNDVVKQYRSTMTTADKFLLRFLSNHQIKELNEKFDKRAKMRNKGTQTKSQNRAACVQTEHNKLPFIPEVEVEEPELPTSALRTKRLYIYNTGE